MAQPVHPRINHRIPIHAFHAQCLLVDSAEHPCFIEGSAPFGNIATQMPDRRAREAPKFNSHHSTSATLRKKRVPRKQLGKQQVQSVSRIIKIIYYISTPEA